MSHTAALAKQKFVTASRANTADEAHEIIYRSLQGITMDYMVEFTRETRAARRADDAVDRVAEFAEAFDLDFDEAFAFMVTQVANGRATV